MMELLDRLTPAFIRQWDQKLLVTDPLLWSTRIVMLLAAAVGLVLISQADAWLTPISLDAVPSESSKLLLWVIPSLVVLVVWLLRVNVFRPDRFIVGQPGGIAWRVYLAFLLGVSALVTVPVLHAFTLHQRMQAAFDFDQVNADKEVLDMAAQYANYLSPHAVSGNLNLENLDLPSRKANSVMQSSDLKDDESLISSYFEVIARYGDKVPSTWTTQSVINSLKQDGYTWHPVLTDWKAKSNVYKIHQIEESSGPLDSQNFVFVVMMMLLLGLGASIVSVANPRESLLAIGLGLGLIISVPLSAILLEALGGGGAQGDFAFYFMLLSSAAVYTTAFLWASNLRVNHHLSLLKGGILALLPLATTLAPLGILLLLDTADWVALPNVGGNDTLLFSSTFLCGSMLLGWASWILWFRPRISLLHALPENR